MALYLRGYSRSTSDAMISGKRLERLHEPSARATNSSFNHVGSPGLNPLSAARGWQPEDKQAASELIPLHNVDFYFYLPYFMY